MKENKSRKILFENGPRQMMRMEKSVACNVFGVYIPISMNLIVDENRKDLMVKRASLTRNKHFCFCIGGT